MAGDFAIDATIRNGIVRCREGKTESHNSRGIIVGRVTGADRTRSFRAVDTLAISARIARN